MRRTLCEAATLILNHFFKVMILISIAVFLFMYWQKDRYVYLRQEYPSSYSFIIFDKQTGDLYYTSHLFSDEWFQAIHFKKNIIKDY